MDEHLYISALEAIYDATLEPESWPIALTRISDFCGGACGNLFYVREDGAYGLIGSTTLPAELIKEYHAKWWKYDLRSHRGLAQEYSHWCNVQCDHDLLSDEEINASPYYQDFLSKYSLKLFMAIGVSPDPTIRVAISISFPIEHARPTDTDFQLLQRIAPHIENALRLSLRIEVNKLIADGLKSVLEHLDVGVILLDSKGLVAFSNAAAHEIFGEKGAVIGQLPQFGTGRIQKLASLKIERLLEGDIPADLTRPLLITDPKGNLSAVIYVLPINRPPQIEGANIVGSGVIILAVTAAKGAPLAPSIVRDLLGLTLSEAKVAALVGAGASRQEAAARLGVSNETVKMVLKRVFAKAGISKQSELALLLSKPSLSSSL